MTITKNLLLNWYSSMKKTQNDFWYKRLFLKVRFRHFLGPMGTSLKFKSKKYVYFTDFFAKIYSLLTLGRKTPPLRSHYRHCWKCHQVSTMNIWFQRNLKFQIQNFPRKVTFSRSQDTQCPMWCFPLYVLIFEFQ